MRAILFDLNGNIDQQVDFEWHEEKPPGAIKRDTAVFVTYEGTMGINRYHQARVFDLSKKKATVMRNPKEAMG